MLNFNQVGRKIIGVARNFKAHALELQNLIPENPVLFLKPTSSIITEGKPIILPPDCSELHHEIELGVIIEKECFKVKVADALQYVGGYCLALDMTARTYQTQEMKNGYSWTLGKCFDTSCPLSRFVSKQEIKNPNQVRLWCKVNDTLHQVGNTKDMIFSVEYIISFVSQFMTLWPGDLILTGTPEGISAVKPGDVIEGGLDNLVSFKFFVGNN